MGLFEVIMGINMDFMSKAETNFPNEFINFLTNRRREKNATLSLWQRNFGVDKDQIKMILQNKTVAQEWAKDHVFESHYLEMHLSLFNALRSLKERMVEEATRLKSSLSSATVAREHELFDDVNQFENSRRNGVNPITDLIDNLESKIENNYECST
ncbi:GL24375 [Drosophila persimilis]|uniref:GL24375 n=1 Tax=Drosophila persimilis TaxID=7234 RepID=B4G5J7_DROPE|nr:GL24375 [Drosophila persimilis]